MSFEVQAALDAIGEPHSRKKRCTVLRLAEARATGVSVRTVFEQDDTCNVQTWYGRGANDTGWKDDPAIASALEVATKRAQWWQDQEEGQRIALRQKQLAATQDELVDLSALATQTLADLMMNADSEKVRLEAAETVLDRADEATARKIVAATDLSVTSNEAAPTMNEIRRRQRQRGERAHMDAYVPLEGEVTTTANIMYSDANESVPAVFVEQAGDDGDGVEWFEPSDDDE
jgi:hypothetical protein